MPVEYLRRALHSHHSAPPSRSAGETPAAGTARVGDDPRLVLPPVLKDVSGATVNEFHHHEPRGVASATLEYAMRLRALGVELLPRHRERVCLEMLADAIASRGRDKRAAGTRGVPLVPLDARVGVIRDADALGSIDDCLPADAGTALRLLTAVVARLLADSNREQRARAAAAAAAAAAESGAALAIAAPESDDEDDIENGEGDGQEENLRRLNSLLD